jgi:hypothetical protein
MSIGVFDVGAHRRALLQKSLPFYSRRLLKLKLANALLRSPPMHIIMRIKNGFLP